MNLSDRRLPRSLQCLHDYTPGQFSHDLIAGITVGLVALPLAMAFAIASGVSPQAGLYTAVVAGFLISALGGSRTQIGGPTGAFVVIVAGIVAKFGVSGLALVSIMAGLLLLIMGLTGLGTAVKYIPRPVTIGFTNGIAVLIASTQIKDFFGLATPPAPSEFLPRIAMLLRYAPTVHWQSLAVAAASLAIILFWPRILAAFPAPSSRCCSPPLPRRSSICRSKPSAAASAVFRRDFPTSPSPRFTPNTFFPCSLPRSPWRCWRPSKACSPPWLPTA